MTATMSNDILENLQAAARMMGRRTTVSRYHGVLDLVFKMDKTPENWVRWGLCSSPGVEIGNTTYYNIDIPSTPELTPRWVPHTSSASFIQCEDADDTLVGRRTTVSRYDDVFDPVFEIDNRVEIANTIYHNDIPSTPELTPRWVPHTGGASFIQCEDADDTPMVRF